MISAPNLRQPLSGSNWFWIFLLGSFLLGGCGVFGPAAKKTDKGQDEDLVKGTSNQTPATVDTIIWKKIPESEAPPITERAPARNTEFKDVYNIALLAPFGARQFQSTSDRPSSRMVRMIEFLAGAQYAIENCLDKVQIRLHVVDTEESTQFENTFSSIPAITEADLIIGPYYTDQVEAVSAYALENQKVLVSPWNTVELSQPNPYYIQMRPSLKSHAQRLAQFAEDNYSREEVMLITKDDPRDIETLAYFQDHSLDSTSKGEIRQEIIPDIGNSELTDSLAVYIQERGYRRFIVPVWSDEPFIIAALAKLNFAKGEEDITVLGLPQWMEMTRMDYEYFENLHVHLSTARPVEYTSTDARNLRSNYIATYGDTPGSDAFYGMSVFKWLAHLLRTEGSDITTGLGSKIPDLEQEFDFIAAFGEDGETIHHYENQKVDIIRFSDFRFQKVE